VSLSPSTTRPFDAPEFILTPRHRHPTRGHGFCPRVLYSLNPPFWPNSGTLRLPVSRCYTKYADPWEAGAELGSSDPTVVVEKSDRGALIKLTNIGSIFQFRNKYDRAGKKSSRQLLGTDVQVDGYKARALLDPGCEAELVLSTSFATQCGMHSPMDEETLVAFADGTRVPSTFIENVSLSGAGVSHPVRAVVVELAAYEVILGNPG
jgi:hypothetical protein